jgi:hypothetical protein
MPGACPSFWPTVPGRQRAVSRSRERTTDRIEPAQLARALLNVAAYKLTFLAAGGLLAAGALLLRRGRRSSSDHAPTALAEDARQLAGGLPPELRVVVRERDARA